jgi:hypothetical protein
VTGYRTCTPETFTQSIHDEEDEGMDVDSDDDDDEDGDGEDVEALTIDTRNHHILIQGPSDFSSWCPIDEEQPLPCLSAVRPRHHWGAGGCPTATGYPMRRGGQMQGTVVDEGRRRDWADPMSVVLERERRGPVLVRCPQTRVGDSMVDVEMASSRHREIRLDPALEPGEQGERRDGEGSSNHGPNENENESLNLNPWSPTAPVCHSVSFAVASGIIVAGSGMGYNNGVGVGVGDYMSVDGGIGFVGMPGMGVSVGVGMGMGGWNGMGMGLGMGMGGESWFVGGSSAASSGGGGDSTSSLLGVEGMDVDVSGKRQGGAAGGGWSAESLEGENAGAGGDGMVTSQSGSSLSFALG